MNLPKTPMVNTPGTSLDVAVEKIAREVDLWAFVNGWDMGTMYGSTTWPDHSNRRCVDFMVSAVSKAVVRGTKQRLTSAQTKTAGYLIADYIWANRERFGLSWEIWRGRIRRAWSNNHATKPVGRWALYFKPTTHFDHVHAEFNGSTYQPPTVYLDRLTRGRTNSDSVRWVQAALNLLGYYNKPPSGEYGSVTMAAVKAYQTALGDQPVDGDIGPKQTRRLFADTGIPIRIEEKA